MLPRPIIPPFVIVVLTWIAGCGPPSSSEPSPETVHIGDRLEDFLEVWYPNAVDSAYGGYLSAFSFDWRPVGPQGKFIVTQARHVWTASRAAILFPESEVDYLGIAHDGYRFLRDAMYDHENGGFRSFVSREGVPLSVPGEFTSGKTAYGNAFGIYALAAYFEASGDSTVLEFAREAFRWLDGSAHDQVYGGYFQFISDGGLPSPEGRGNHPAKDQNSSIHLLEAFTELYRVWPDPVLRDRLQEMLVVVRDTIAADTGYLRLFFDADWTPVSYRDSSRTFILEHLGLDHVSFGHDIETAFLMMEAAELLGVEQDVTLAKGKVMVDHAIRYGWDQEFDGFHDGGYYFTTTGPPEIVIEDKTWWVQSEGLNALLLMAEHYPDDPRDYAGLFDRQIAYIDRYLVDHDHGGWYWSGLDRNPESREAAKASIWKAAYHDGRALMNLYNHPRHETE